jgi:hypothetical protein
MLSTDLAKLYGVAPRVLVQAVKRNRERFPQDFMFQLTRPEFANLKSQIVISSWGGARRATPYAFTEQGVAMLSSVLRSPSRPHRVRTRLPTPFSCRPSRPLVTPPIERAILQSEAFLILEVLCHFSTVGSRRKAITGTRRFFPYRLKRQGAQAHAHEFVVLCG